MTGFPPDVVYTPDLFRQSLIGALCSAATDMLLDHKPKKRGTAVVGALEQALIAYEELVLATSKSNAGFEFRNLQMNEQVSWERAKHVIKMLKAVHAETEGVKRA